MQGRTILRVHTASYEPKVDGTIVALQMVAYITLFEGGLRQIIGELLPLSC